MTKTHQTQIKLSLEDTEVLYLALSNLKSDSVSVKEWDARDRLMKRLQRAQTRL